MYKFGNANSSDATYYVSYSSRDATQCTHFLFKVRQKKITSVVNFDFQINYKIITKCHHRKINWYLCYLLLSANFIISFYPIDLYYTLYLYINIK